MGSVSVDLDRGETGEVVRSEPSTSTLKMSWRIVIALMFASAAMAQEDTNLSIKDAEGVSKNDREGKFFSVFQIVKFKNGMCTTSTGDAGTCYTEAECAAAGGTASGPCASSFGVCCMCKCFLVTKIFKILQKIFHFQLWPTRAARPLTRTTATSSRPTTRPPPPPACACSTSRSVTATSASTST